MSKKVLIIRSTVVTKDSQLLRDARAIAESIANSGVVMLPANYTYEFGEIDGVIWEGEKNKKCEECHEKNNMRFSYCCLIECGEHEFCRGCRRTRHEEK